MQETAIPNPTQTQAPKLVGLMAEFIDVEPLLAATRKVRDAGYTRWDVHSPFPIHGIDRAMGAKPTILPWIVLMGGLTGLVAGLGLEFFANAFSYKYMVSGKPIAGLPPFIPVVFETTVLFSAFAAVFGMLFLNKLPKLYNPLFRSARFRRATSDRFFIVIESSDPKFDAVASANQLLNAGAAHIEKVED